MSCEAKEAMSVGRKVGGTADEVGGAKDAAVACPAGFMSAMKTL